jgi:hypothetical protein
MTEVKSKLTKNGLKNILLAGAFTLGVSGFGVYNLYKVYSSPEYKQYQKSTLEKDICSEYLQTKNTNNYPSTRELIGGFSTIIGLLGLFPIAGHAILNREYYEVEEKEKKQNDRRK